MPFHLRSPGPKTPAEDLRILLMGSSRIDAVYRPESWPLYATGEGWSAFPMAFLCRSDYEVKLLQPLGRFLRAMRDSTPAQQLEHIDRLAMLPSLASLLTDKGKGDVHQFYDGQEDPKLKRLDTLAQAIKYMIARGQNIAAAKELSEDFEAFTARFDDLEFNYVDVPPIPAQPRTPTARARSAAVTPARSAGRPQRHQFGQRRYAKGSNAVCPSVEDVDSEDDNKPSMATSSGAKGKSAMQAGPVGATAQPLKYMKHRNVEGDVLSVSLAAPRARRGELVPSLGSIIDEFVDSFGYDNTYILNAYDARLQCDTQDEFICVMGPILTVMEAKWLWRWISLPPADPLQCKRDHVDCANFQCDGGRASKNLSQRVSRGVLSNPPLGAWNTVVAMVVVVSKAQRYFKGTRTILASKPRVPWRYRTKVQKTQTKSLTPAEKKTRSDQRKSKNEFANKKLDDALLQVWKLAEALFEDVGTNSVKYWYERLLQQSGNKKHTRQTSRWNAFVSKEMKLRNDALPLGVPRPKVNDLITDIRDVWKAMSKEEQAEATEDELVRLAEVKDMKKTAVHHVSLNAFHDARATLASVQGQMEALHNRTGLEILLVAVRSDSQSVVVPQVWTTGDRVDEFFQLTNNMSIADFAGKLECFCLSGMQGTANTYHNELMQLKSKTSKLIYNELEGRPDALRQLQGTHHGQVWYCRHELATPSIVAPGTIGSRLELQTLYNAWSSGSTYFRKFTRDELEIWEQQCSLTGGSPSGSTAGETSTVSPGNQSPAGDSSSAIPAGIPSSASSPVSPPLNEPGPSTVSPQTGVFSVSNTPLVGRKPRKQRSDKGKKRGPSAKSRAKQASENVPAGDGASTSM
ncbi:hypothetical protein BC835DRAFT_1410887 [Cytidiella melzeri]|nr:hypothetical protein BC835DRAFT_1410887 [Cytidiella melzeri]